MSTDEESGTRSRTRRAVLAAAAQTLSRDRSATLADIAYAADVSRSTLHRYFSDRDELVAAVVEDSLRVLEESVAAAAIHEGPAIEALRRLVTALVDVGDRLMFLFGDPRVLDGGGGAVDPQESVVDLVRRGRAEGVFDPELSPRWIEQVLHALVYTGVTEAAEGALPRHGVAALVTRTLEHGIGGVRS
ncbi:TetR/AcrR family transcriptional regulator [Umezawaea beigongshangensis]|uniref:TetR/AcrR family transcriptional regulator n=1 Tax=Umezawaea beigongshangensis TaxID=2780383 RepID=UPI0018F142A5|nr:TetR/AcrR family transcriptional regulator [Umezawaea beigongshangensis]